MPEAPTTQRTEWRGRHRRWRWIGIAGGIWLALLVVAYAALARKVTSNLESARAEVEATVARLPKPQPARIEAADAGSAGTAAKTASETKPDPNPRPNPATASSARRLTALDWIARVSGAFAESFGQQTLPPRLPGGSARTLGLPGQAFGTLPHYGIGSEASLGPQVAAPECSGVDPDVLGDEMRLANWRAELEDRPVQLLARRDCFALVVEWRESIEKIPLDAFECDSTVATPPERWFELLERENLPAPTPALAGAVWAARRLADSAVVHAARGDVATARAHLGKALAACETLEGATWVTGYAAWSEAELQVLERVALCLVLLDPADLPAELDAHLARLQPRDRYLASLPGELRLIERDFQRAKDGLTSRARTVGSDEFAAGPVSSLQMDQELADCFQSWSEHAKWAENTPYSAGSPAPAVRSALSSNVFNFMLMPPGIGCRHPWGELAALKELVQLARIATLEGAAAARSAAASRVDPFSGAPFATRLEADGTLVLWSIGEDRKDDAAQPRLTCDPTLDIVVRVLAR